MERKSTGSSEQQSQKRSKKQSEYGKQLEEKQKVRDMYGMRERQFRRFFDMAIKSREGVPGENLLSLLERRLDNTLYRLKLATTRAQARQVITHGHVFVNGRRVYSPSFLVGLNDEVTFAPKVSERTAFVAQAIDKRLNTGIKVPEWLELDKKAYKGRVLRMPVRTDIGQPIEEHLIVELYSK